MEFTSAERIARALLYEGYLLYPYRRSAVKNQQRWTFGCLFPPDYPQPEGSAEGSEMRVEVLVQGNSTTALDVHGRFLQMMSHTGDEIVERECTTGRIKLTDLLKSEDRREFAFPGINGTIDLSALRLDDDLFKLCVHLRNLTALMNGNGMTREHALMWSFLSSHLMLGIEQGRFLSIQDPPDAARELANSCRNERAWPILVGDPERCDTMLAAPIILSDFPQIAAESPGDLFDSTEMDEMLTLRIRTLTIQEKDEMAAGDLRAGSLLTHTEALDDDRLRALHGAWRTNEESATPQPPVNLQPGMRVRLRPKGSADIFDVVLHGKTATIVSIERDFEDRDYVSVVIEDDPGQDFGIAGKPGHRFYFRPDEVEALAPRILIAGIGNIFFGDDAFGVEVARRLADQRLPAGVQVKDFGIRGFDLACALQEDYDAVILVDAMARGGLPGTLVVIEPDTDSITSEEPMEMHRLDPERVIQMVRQMGGRLPALRVVGCEPSSLAPADELSEPVRRAMPKAIELIEVLVAKLRETK